MENIDRKKIYNKYRFFLKKIQWIFLINKIANKESHIPVLYVCVKKLWIREEDGTNDI